MRAAGVSVVCEEMKVLFSGNGPAQSRGGGRDRCGHHPGGGPKRIKAGPGARRGEGSALTSGEGDVRAWGGPGVGPSTANLYLCRPLHEEL